MPDQATTADFNTNLNIYTFVLKRKKIRRKYILNVDWIITISLTNLNVMETFKYSAEFVLQKHVKIAATSTQQSSKLKDRVSLRLANRPSLAGYWKFNASLLEIRDFWDRLESLIKRALVEAVTGNRWWVSLKHRIRDFATKYDRQLNLDRTKEAKSIDDRLSWAVARGDLERESSERYKGYVVRSRLRRVLNEAMKTKNA